MPKHHTGNKAEDNTGIGNINTQGMICTCQGSSCSCIGENDAHCIWEEDDKCIELDAITENGMNLHIKYHYMHLYSNALL